ncbi:uncharacterized protein Z518_11158 [Rhinocladiella mackenziei CBS 650.93]|uniref:Uncharacterized protein n=1 Tax=Rhinocladiella mackenziei CBS 650.93 TaxID=1442369 RepID=A0A0D2I910_9EURO|nr:uncharacterized protein Z518_11158 [Rhinocladiella mackenziei CBS 650.93]KIW99745.1 hypothetical protein Z518_11158 [Rhinocladiella mackenziei CBS 650.93]
MERALGKVSQQPLYSQGPEPICSQMLTRAATSSRKFASSTDALGKSVQQVTAPELTADVEISNPNIIEGLCAPTYTAFEVNAAEVQDTSWLENTLFGTDMNFDCSINEWFDA